MTKLQLVFICASLFSTGCLISGCASSPHARNGIPANNKQEVKAMPADDKTWDLVWDDKVDDSLDMQSKSCRLHLTLNGKVSGRFDGPVLGTPRNARFVGTIIHSDKTSLLLLRQIEKNYTCVYEMQALKDGNYFGVWHDTLGRKGDVELQRAMTTPSALSRDSTSSATANN
jgi:hypothetical protein